MNAGEFNTRLIAQVKRIRAAEDDYRRAIARWAEADRLYNIGQAVAVTQIDDAKNAGERDARAELLDLEGLHPELVKDATVANLRFVADQGKHLVNAAKLSLQARMAELSALQSEASLAKEEARFMSTAPSEVIPT